MFVKNDIFIRKFSVKCIILYNTVAKFFILLKITHETEKDSGDITECDMRKLGR